MPDDIQLTPEFKARIRELRQTFDFILSGKENPELGIYPVVVDGEVKGIRLGGKTPKEEGSACFIASTHQNELIGWKALDAILDKWQHPHDNRPALKDAGLDGDIYLIFGGQKARVEALLDAMSAPDRHTMSIDENTDFRERLEADGSRANANRVRQDIKAAGGYDSLNMADKKLIADQDRLEQAVYRKCKLVLDIHSMSQAAEPVLIPHPPKSVLVGKSADTQDRILRGIARKWKELSENIGVADMFTHLSIDQHGWAFTGPETAEHNFRGIFEGGGPHNDPAIWERGAKAAEGVLGTLWPEKLAYLQPEEKSTPRVHGRMIHFYLPDSPNAAAYMPDTAKLCHEAKGEKWHLLTDGEKVPEPVKQKIAELCTHAELPKGRLANGAQLQGGSPIAYAWNEATGAVSLLGFPGDEAGVATMFPAAATNLAPDRAESIGGVALPLGIERALPRTAGENWVDTAANMNTPDANKRAFRR